jgi:carbonic anhydrase/acetyltransferase-like protein (isoleucine patch superfamily)
MYSQVLGEIKQSEGTQPLVAKYTVIQSGAVLKSCKLIHDCFIGQHATVVSATLNHVVIHSEYNQQTHVRNNASVAHSVIFEGCVVEDMCFLDHAYLAEESHVGVNARVCHSILAPDSSVSGGECHHSVVGPFIGFHHHSLLIATIWMSGRGNIGYGAMIGSNHTGRVNDQECWMGEGCFVGLNVSIKFPFNSTESSYSIIASDTSLAPQAIRFPFSLITSFPNSHLSPDGCSSQIRPGWVVSGNPYMIERCVISLFHRLLVFIFHCLGRHQSSLVVVVRSEPTRLTLFCDHTLLTKSSVLVNGSRTI